MGLRLSFHDYRQGALTRMAEAQILCDQQKWVGAIYLAGRAVEALLRSLLWFKTREQEVGHDLRELLAKVRSLGLVKAAEDNAFKDSLNELAVIWHNDLRFVGEAWLRRRLSQLGRSTRIGDMRVMGDPLKANAKRVLETCEAVLSRGERLWIRLSKN